MTHAILLSFLAVLVLAWAFFGWGALPDVARREFLSKFRRPMLALILVLACVAIGLVLAFYVGAPRIL